MVPLLAAVPLFVVAGTQTPPVASLPVLAVLAETQTLVALLSAADKLADVADVGGGGGGGGGAIATPIDDAARSKGRGFARLKTNMRTRKLIRQHIADRIGKTHT